MSDAESVEGQVPLQNDKQPQPELARLSGLPLDVLLYYVLYGDEQLARLNV